MEIKNIENNGVKIPNECECIWCGGKMERAGANYMGAGVNQFALWCKDCGVVVIHAKDWQRKINGFSIKFEFEENN